MALVAPGICRYSIIGTLDGQECVNIVDVDIDVPTIGGDRSYSINAIAGDILNNWNDHLLPLLQPEYVAQEVRWVDLNSADGETGSRRVTSAVTWPRPGTQSGSMMPNNVAMRAVKNISGGTRQDRRGSMFIAGMSEGYTLDSGSPNRWDPAAVTAFNDALEDFKDGVNGTTGTETRNLAMVHTVEGEYRSSSHISTYAVSPRVATMRRRMPGYGS